jgi:hypothetical protein
MNRSFRRTVTVVLVGLIAGCAHSPLDAQFKRLCETEGGAKITHSPTPQSSILFRADLLNRVDDSERSFNVQRSGCNWLCQRWLKAGVFDFIEAEIDVGTGAQFDLVPTSARGKGNHLTYSMTQKVPGVGCVETDRQMPEACIVSRPSGAPISTYYYRYQTSVVAKADKAVIFKESRQIRTVRDDAPVVSATEFVHTWPSSLNGSGSSGEVCPRGGVPFPIELFKQP